MAAKFRNFMEEALEEARAAHAADEVPVGAVIVYQNQVIGRGQNRTRRELDPTAHAEIVAIRQAAQSIKNFRLEDCDLYVTLEPCAMCAGAIAEARIARLYFGAEDQKSGGTLHNARVFDHPGCHSRPEIYGGINEADSEQLMQEFFALRRK